MKARHIFVSLLTVFAVGITTGCGHKSEKQEAEDLQNEGQTRISAEKASRADLSSNYNIELLSMNADSQAAQKDWSVYSAADRKKIEAKLYSHWANTNRIMEIGNHKNMVLSGGEGLHYISKNAKAYYDKIHAYNVAHPS